jgi:hypothetical protein
MTARTLVMGDWSRRGIRDPIDLLRLALLVGAVVCAVTGPATGAGYLAFSAVATFGARLANLPRVLDLSFVLAMSLTGWGEAFGLYDTYPWFDRVVHFLVPLLGAPVAYIGLARLDVLPDPRDETTRRHHWGMFVVTFALGLAIGAFWEVVEWTSDGTLGSNLSEGNDDTVGDLIADASGSLLGAVGLVLWSTRGWGSVRRIPGENRYEATDD